MVSNRWEKHKNVYVFVDGASSGNPGCAGIGIVISIDGKKRYLMKNIGTATNNEAEYTALLSAIQLLEKEGISNATIFSDSRLVVKQINGEYKIKSERLKRYAKKIKSLLEKNAITIKWIEREKNREADMLAKKASRKC